MKFSNMAQKEIWEQEYNKKTLVSGDSKPQAFINRMLRKYRFKSGKDFNEWVVLDLGSGTGRNTNYLAKKGADAHGIEIASNAIRVAQERAKDDNLKVQYYNQSIGEKYPFIDNKFDIILDITSSNSLNEEERTIYLNEVQRVLKPEGVFMVRGLLLDGDKNAKNLIKQFPGPEHHTYILPEIGLTERVFTKDEFYKLYGEYFKIEKFDKFTTYTPFKGQPYKRNFFFAWMKVKPYQSTNDTNYTNR